MENGFLHGEDCWIWNIFRDVACITNNHFKIRKDKGNPIFLLKESIAIASEGVGAMCFLPSALNINVMNCK